MSHSKDMYVGITLLLHIIDKLTAASVLIRNARTEGRDVTPEEIAAVKGELEISLDILNSTIAQKESDNAN